MTFNLKRIHKAVNWNKEDDGFTQAFWEQNVKQFWLPEEISVSKDLKCWSMLSEKEKINIGRAYIVRYKTRK